MRIKNTTLCVRNDTTQQIVNRIMIIVIRPSYNARPGIRFFLRTIFHQISINATKGCVQKKKINYHFAETHAIADITSR